MVEEEQNTEDKGRESEGKDMSEECNEIPEVPEIPDVVKYAAKYGNLTFFVGNGLSRLYGLPSWEEMADCMLEKIKKVGEIDYNTFCQLKALPTKQKISIADSHFRVKPSEKEEDSCKKSKELNYKFILESSIKNNNNIYKLLADCKARYITTNYDSLFRKALERKSQLNIKSKSENRNAPTAEKKCVYDSLNSFSEEALLRNSVLLHLHGSLEKQKDMVVSTVDYLNFYNSEENQEKLQTILKNQTIVFIGYEPNEWEILGLIFRALNKGEGRLGKVFLLLPMLSHEKKMQRYLEVYWKNLFVEILPFNIDKKGYESVGNVIERWADQLSELSGEPTRYRKLDLIDEKIKEFNEAEPRDKREKIAKKALGLVGEKNKDREYFYKELKNFDWLNYLHKAGEFKFENTDEANLNIQWQQIDYLERIGDEISNKGQNEIGIFLTAIMGICKLEISVPYVLNRIVKIIFMIPTNFLSEEALEVAFEKMKKFKNEKHFIHTDIVEQVLSKLLEQLGSKNSSKERILEYIKRMFSLEDENESPSEDYQFKFLDIGSFADRWGSFLKFDSIYEKDPQFIDVLIDLFSKELKSLLDGNSQLDESSKRWRPVVMHHIKNAYNKSVPSIFVDILFSLSSQLLKHGKRHSHVDNWRDSKSEVFQRLFLALSVENSELMPISESYKFLMKEPLDKGVRFEKFKYLEKYFNSFSNEKKDEVFNKISSMSTQLEGLTDEDKIQENADKKLRWLAAIKNSRFDKAKKLREELLKVTAGRESEHPEFDFYTSVEYRRVESPWSLADLEKKSPKQIIDLIKSADFSVEAVGYGKKIELLRTLEEYVGKHPLSAVEFIDELSELDFLYTSYIISGFKTALVNKKVFQYKKVLEKLKGIIFDPSFKGSFKNELEKRRINGGYDLRNFGENYLISSASEFISAGCNLSKISFDEAFGLLKKLLKFELEESTNSQDFLTEAINSSRGKTLERLIVLSWTNCNKEDEEIGNHKKTWENLKNVIAPILDNDNEGLRVSLHAMLGEHYSGFLYFDQDWFFKNLKKIVRYSKERPNENLSSWKAFMDGFSYANEYSRDLYKELHSMGVLKASLRDDSPMREGMALFEKRLSRLQETVINHAVAAYLLGHDEKLIEDVIEYKSADEWQKLPSATSSFYEQLPKLEENFEKIKQLLKKMFEAYDKSESKREGIDWTEHFSSLYFMLELFQEHSKPQDPLVEKIVRLISKYREPNSILSYFRKNVKENPRRIGELYKIVVQEGRQEGRDVPTWPKKEIREICEELKKIKEQSDVFLEICKAYADSTYGCEIIRDICDGARDHD